MDQTLIEFTQNEGEGDFLWKMCQVMIADCQDFDCAMKESGVVSSDNTGDGMVQNRLYPRRNQYIVTLNSAHLALMNIF